MMRVMLVELSAMPTARPYYEAARHVADTVWDEAIQGEGYTARVEVAWCEGKMVRCQAVGFLLRRPIQFGATGRVSR